MGHIFSSNLNSQKMVPHMISIWFQSDCHIADKKCYVQVDIVYSILKTSKIQVVFHITPKQCIYYLRTEKKVYIQTV